MNTSITPLTEQKLVTVYLDNTAYAKGKMLVGSFADKHGNVEEHLGEFLKQGWRVATLHGFGGGGESLALRGWLTVLLERSNDYVRSERNQA